MDVLARLPSELETDVHLVLTGPGWQDRWVTRPMRGVQVYYFPFLPRTVMPDFYRAIDTYTVTSRVEGGPAPLLEAMTCGTAVITTPVGTALDFVEDDVNGLVVPINGVNRAVSRVSCSTGTQGCVID